MLNEIWKAVRYYEDLYEVSNYGRVRSLERIIIDKNGKCKTVHEKFLTQHDNGRGYLFVNLWKNNKCKREYVHRLVALAFIENPNKLPQVNHKDEDKQNNYVENLEWCTSEYNNNYGNHVSKMISTCVKNGVYEQFSERMKKDNPNKGQYKGGNNHYAKKVICDGKVFDCLKDCADYYNINYGTFRGYLSNYMPKRFRELGLSYI